jgi:hypothetical protein
MMRLANLKKAIMLVSVLCTVGLPIVSGASVGAVNVLPFCDNTNNADKTVVCKERKAQPSGNPIIGAIRVAIQIFTVILGVAAVIVIIISGLKYITAGGDTNAVESARRTLIYALVGLAVAALAQAIVSLVLSKL